MTIPFSPPPFLFVTTIKGFIFIDESKSQTEFEVSKIVGDMLFTKNHDVNTATAVKRFIANNKDNLPNIIKCMDDALRYLRKSITIQRFDLVKRKDIGTESGKGNPAWNVYMYPPTTNHNALRDWRSLISKIVFITNENGAGRSTKKFSCMVCRSIDHPGGMCPFPKQQGWNAPAPTNSPALDDLLNASQPQGRGHTARGRGFPNDRSRGNRGRGTPRA